jgi:hypothetical protein
MSAIAEVIRVYSIRYDLDQDHFSQVCDELVLFIGELMSGKRPELARASVPETSR